MDFCTTRRNKDNQLEYSWYQMRFNSDFVRMLKDYGRMPLKSIRECMDVVKENEELQERFDHLRKNDDAKKQSLDKIIEIQKQRHL